MPRIQAVPTFDLDSAELPPAIVEAALASGGYPYTETMKRKAYEAELEPLQIELLKLAAHLEKTGGRLVVTLDGRDAAGKGGLAKALLENMNPRHAHHVALAKPSDQERGQWYFQRYVPHLPTAGDISIFERSWYNRAGVEAVMSFCTPEQTQHFLAAAPHFEAMLVQDGMTLVKLFLDIGREKQMVELHERRHDPLKRWKLTDIDLAAIPLWDAYTAAFDMMLARTHSPAAPWHVVKSNDKRRARLAAIRHILVQFDYAGRDSRIATTPDAAILAPPAQPSRAKPAAAKASR